MAAAVVTSRSLTVTTSDLTAVTARIGISVNMNTMNMNMNMNSTTSRMVDNSSESPPLLPTTTGATIATRIQQGGEAPAVAAAMNNPSSNICLFRCLLMPMRGTRRRQQQRRAEAESNNNNDNLNRGEGTTRNSNANVNNNVNANANNNGVPRDDAATRQRGGHSRERGRYLLQRRTTRRRRRNEAHHETHQQQEATTTTIVRTSETMTVRERRRRERKVKQERDERMAQIDKHLIVKVVQVQSHDSSSQSSSSTSSDSFSTPNNINKQSIQTTGTNTSTTTAPSSLKNPLSSYKVLDSNTKTTSSNGVRPTRPPREQIIYLNPAFCPTTDATDVTSITNCSPQSSSIAVTSSTPAHCFKPDAGGAPPPLPPPPPQAPSHLHEPNCPICWEPYKQGDLVSCSPNPNCCHSYHVSCITTWLLKPNDECPMCRSDYLNRIKNKKHAKARN